MATAPRPAALLALLTKHRRLVSAVLVLLLAGGGAWVWTRGAAESEGGKRGRRSAAVAVETAPVRQSALRDLRRFSGTLQAQARFVVAAKTAGRVEQLSVDIGDRVQNGQVVVRLDDDEAVQQVDQARAELGVAKAGLAEARSVLSVKQRQHARMRQLHERRIASDAELEATQVDAEAQQARVQVAQAQVTQREAALRAAEVRLSYTVIRAAWSDGKVPRIVGERFVNEGDQVAPNQPLISVVDLAALTAVVNAAERDYPGLQVGQPATVTAEAYPQRHFLGEITRLAPVFKEASRQARVEVRVANADGVLKPGMFASVEVEVGQVPDAASVPIEAVVNREGRPGVFVPDPETRTARFVPVQTGIVQDGRVQIVEPALDGTVITLGNHLLADGVAIVLPDRAREPSATAADGQGERPGGKRKRKDKASGADASAEPSRQQGG